MMARWNRHLTPIGLDIGQRQLTAVQLRRAGAKWQVESAAVVPRQGATEALSGEEAERLCDVLYRNAFEGVEVVVAAPPDKVFDSVLELPPAGSGAPLEQIARAELARMHKREPGSFEIASWPLPPAARAARGCTTLATGLSHDVAETMLDALEAQGLEVLAVDLEALALTRACGSLLKQVDGLAAILELGWRSARLVMLRGDVVIYQRSFDDVALHRLYDRLIDRLELEQDVAEFVLRNVGLNASCSDEHWHVRADAHKEIADHFDALIGELRLSFAYAMHQYGLGGIELLLLTGKGAIMPGLAEHLSASLSVAARNVTAKDLVEFRPAMATGVEPAVMTTALGLAMYDMH